MPGKSLLALPVLVSLLLPAPGLQAQSDSLPATGDQTLTQAQPPVLTATPSVRRYLVEVIVFNNLGPISADGEIWDRSTVPINFSPEEYSTEPEIPGSDFTELTDETIRYTELKALLPHLYKLYASPLYDVMTYAAWTQPLLQKKESIKVELSPPLRADSLRDTRPTTRSIQGSLRLFENRLLFVDLDVRNFFESTDFTTFPEQTQRPPGTYRLSEKRRVKLNEVHYFDHPFFGALVRVSRWEPNQPTNQ